MADLPLEQLNINGGNSNDEETPLPIESIEEIINYRFENKNLLREAFTHKSYGDEDDDDCLSYERLEFMGDSVLNMIISREFFHLYPKLKPGLLTRLRSANVDSEKLARVALKHGFHRFLLQRKALLSEQIKDFSEAIKDYPLHSNGLVRVPKVLADIVESLIGAIFIDCNSIDTVWEVINPILQPIINLKTLNIHPKTELFEKCQKINLKLRFEDKWEESKEIIVYIEDNLVGRGTHQTKKESARNMAAKDALDKFSNYFSKF